MSDSRHLTILVADDHPVFRKGLIQALQIDPTLKVIHEAPDGENAWAFVQEKQPNVAVLDIAMPRRDGLSVAREIRTRNLPVAVVFITAFRDPELFDEAMSLGVRGYVLKDSAAEDILRAIKTVAQGECFVSPTLANLMLERRERQQALLQRVPALHRLSPTERRVLKLISFDKTSKEIADAMGISIRTVENHRAHISQKLDIHGSHSLLKFAFDNKARL